MNKREPKGKEKEKESKIAELFKPTPLPKKVVTAVKEEAKYLKELGKVKAGRKEGKTAAESLSNLEKTHYDKIKKIHKEYIKQKTDKLDKFKNYINKLTGKVEKEQKQTPKSASKSASKSTESMPTQKIDREKM